MALSFISKQTVHRGQRVPQAVRFSIVIPCFDLGSLAAEAVGSALDQTVSDVEVIVVDDGSRVPVVESLSPFLDRVVIVRKENGGLSSARNAGIREARGEYIVLLDGDDLLLPTHCAACLSLFESFPTCQAAAPDAWIFGEGQPPNVRLSDLYPRTSPVTIETFLSGRSLVPAWCTFRKTVFAGMDEPYDVGFRRAEDFLFNSRLLLRGVTYCFLTEPTYRYRKRAGSLSFENPIPLTRAVLQALDKLESECTVDGAARKALEQARGRYNSELCFHLFREAVLARRYHDALGHARHVRVHQLVPAQRKWKFLASRAMVRLLCRVFARG